MKKIFILILLLFVVSLYGQQTIIAVDVIEPHYTTFTLSATGTETIYVYFLPPAGESSTTRYVVSTSLPTTAVQNAEFINYSATGAGGVSVIPEYVTKEESDSLAAWIHPLVYDATKDAWYISANDSIFIVMDAPRTYTAASIDYLDWTNGECYTFNLTGELQPFAGFALTFYAKLFNVVNSDVKVTLGINIVR